MQDPEDPDDPDDDDGHEDENQHPAVDVPLPDYVAELPPDADLDTLAEAYRKTQRQEAVHADARETLDEEAYVLMLGRLLIARMAKQRFAVKNLGKRDDSPSVKGELDAYGKSECNVRRAQWRKYVRLSEFCPLHRGVR
jgi:hypothetical protein